MWEVRWSLICFFLFFNMQEHWNYFGADENLGPVAVSIRREKPEEIKENGPQYNYRIIFRTSEVSSLWLIVRETGREKAKLSGGQWGLEFFGFSTWIDLSPVYMQSSNLLTKVSHVYREYKWVYQWVIPEQVIQKATVKIVLVKAREICRSYIS